MSKKAQEEQKVEEQKPEVILEVTLKALSDGNVGFVVPQNVNLWVLRGLLARALAASNQIQVKKDDSQE